MSDWGQGAKNNNIGWGQGSVNNNISWGSVHANSWAGDTNIVGFAFDSDYQAILDRAIALGYTLPTLEQQNLQNTLLINMKADGVWAKLDVFYNFANNGSLGFGTINWKNPSLYLASPTNAPTFTSNVGFTGGGTSYIDTNFAPSNGVQYQLNNASRYLYLHTAVVSVNPMDGLVSIGGNTMRRTISTAQNINQSTSPLSTAFDYTATRGMKSIHRTSINDVQLFNGTTGESRIAVSVSRVTNTQAIFRGGSSYSAHTISMYAMGASLISENAAFVADYNTYINAI